MSRKKKGKLKQRTEADANANAAHASHTAATGPTSTVGPSCTADLDVWDYAEVEVDLEGKTYASLKTVGGDKATDPCAHKKDATTRFRPIHGNFRNYYVIRGRSGASGSASTSASGPPASLAGAPSTWTAANSGVVDASARDDIDPRLRQLLAWTAQRHAQLPYRHILDIGCNSGQVTLELAEALAHIYAQSPTRVLGVDIDDELIREANEALAQVREDGLPSSLERREGAEPARKRRRKMADLALPIPVQRHSIALFQPRQVKAKAVATARSPELSANQSSQASISASSWSHSEKDRDGFATALAFQTSDWVKTGSDGFPTASAEKRKGMPPGPSWDLILGLSLTKWVHINNGTEGILRLFARIASELRSPPTGAEGSAANSGGGSGGGVFLLEPQSWSSYKTARSQGPDVRARIRALSIPAPLPLQAAASDSKMTTKKKSKKKKKKRKWDEVDVKSDEPVASEGPEVEPEPKEPEPTEHIYGYPPIGPDDFPFLLSELFGLEGPTEIGQAHGAGFCRPLQVYTQPGPSTIKPEYAELVKRTREDAIRGTLVLHWVPRKL
ncbi:hypothetical protein OC834_006121 [Tilletia horrida]|nr:hypothetical protein OC834_006121 [Tilletia horrida]